MKSLSVFFRKLKHVYVASEQYKIIFLKKFKDFGETDYEKMTITIKDEMSARSTVSTVVHELLHSLDNEHSIGLTHKQIYLLERAIFELLADNFLK